LGYKKARYIPLHFSKIKASEQMKYGSRQIRLGRIVRIFGVAYCFFACLAAILGILYLVGLLNLQDTSSIEVIGVVVVCAYSVPIVGFASIAGRVPNRILSFYPVDAARWLEQKL
jgi:hypothetical protein